MPTRFLVACSVVWLAAAVGAEEIDPRPPLRWKLRTGKTLYYKLERQSVLSVPLEGGTLDIKQTLRLDAHLYVDAARPGGAASLTQRLDRVRLEVSFSNGTSLSYDSDSPEESDVSGGMREALERLSSEPTKLTLSADGKIWKVRPSKRLSKALRALGMKVLQIGGPVSVPGLSELAQAWFFPLPELAPYEGQKWRHAVSRRITPTLYVDLESTYRYLGSEEVNGKRFLRYDSDPSVTIGERSTSEGEVWNVNGSGTALFDPQKGQLVRSESETRFRFKWGAAEGDSKRARLQIRTEVRREKDRALSRARAR